MDNKSTVMNDAMNTGKYQDIFKKGKELFWKYGIKRVTIEEICREAGVSKMTFYKLFPNKMALAKTILDVVFGKSIHRFEQVLHADLPFPEKVKELFMIKLEATKDISVEFISDIHKNPEMGLQHLIEKQRLKSLELFVAFFTDSQKKLLRSLQLEIFN